MKAIIDTSAVISLALTGILRQSMQVVTLIIPDEVQSELQELGKYADAEGHAAHDALTFFRTGRQQLLPVKNKQRIESLISADVHHGEAACVCLCIEQRIPLLIMDDVDAAYALAGKAQARGIMIRISIAVIMQLLKKGSITRDRARALITTMLKRRSWERSVLEVLAQTYLAALR